MLIMVVAIYSAIRYCEFLRMHPTHSFGKRDANERRQREFAGRNVGVTFGLSYNCKLPGARVLGIGFLRSAFAEIHIRSGGQWKSLTVDVYQPRQRWRESEMTGTTLDRSLVKAATKRSESLEESRTSRRSELRALARTCASLPRFARARASIIANRCRINLTVAVTHFLRSAEPWYNAVTGEDTKERLREKTVARCSDIGC